MAADPLDGCLSSESESSSNLVSKLPARSSSSARGLGGTRGGDGGGAGQHAAHPRRRCPATNFFNVRRRRPRLGLVEHGSTRLANTCA